MALTKISTEGVKDNAITKAKIPADQIEASELANNAVDTNAIQDEAVTLAKLPHGDGNSDGKFLRANNGADPSFESIPSGTTINNNAANKVITGDANSDTLNADPNVLISSGKVSTGGETSPDVGAGGLCLQKGTDSNKALTIKNTNVAHGVTSYDETDTFLSIGQSSGNKGGVEIRGYTDAASADPGIRLRGIIASDSDHTYTPLVFIGAEANGTGVQNIAADRRIVCFQNADGSRIVNITGTGITFGDNHAANLALEDYEEGTYTPVVGAAGWNATSSNADGTYVKVGNLVTVHIRYVSSSFSSVGMSDSLYVTLPFAAKSGGECKGTLMCSEWSIGNQNISWIGGEVRQGYQNALFHYHNGNNNNTNQLTKTIANDQVSFKGTVVYQTP